MANVQWQLVYCNLVTGVIIDELPVSTATATIGLNTAGRLACSIPLESARTLNLTGQVQQPQWTPDSVPVCRTALYLVRSGVIIRDALLLTARANVAAGVLELAGEGLHAYFRRRRIRINQTYAAVNQLTIARGLLTAAQSFTNGSIGMTYDSLVAGPSRDRTYLALERKPVAEALEQLAAVDDGFDWYYTATRAGTVITPKINFLYPATGRATDHVFELGTNCAMLDYSEDGSTMANVVDAVGAGDGDDALLVTANNVTLQGSYPLYEDVVAHTDVRETITLAGHARRRLARGAGPMRRVELETFPDTIPNLGAYLVGDRVRVRGDLGWLQVDDLFRITEQQITVAGGAETVKLSLAGLEVFT